MKVLSGENINKMFGIDTNELFSWLIKAGTNIAIALAIFFIGFWIAKIASKGVKKILTKSNTDAGLISFLTSLTSIVLKVLVLVTTINQLGVEMTSFVAIIGAAGLAIGMAFSGTLSNFAGGVMILFFKPFKVGDFVNVQGEEGTVSEIQIFNTFLSTPDNKVIILPNGPVANGNIINFTKSDKRRVTLSIGISYGDDVKLARKVISEIIESDKRILKDPAYFIGLGELAESSINLTVRAWTKTEDYWDVFFQLNEEIYEKIPKAGINFPFPQLDVNLTGNK